MDSPMIIRHEQMRIAGKLVDADSGRNIDVLNPYNGKIVGTVPRASREQVAAAFEIAANYRPTLTRCERQQILLKTAEIIVSRKDEISDLITDDILGATASAEQLGKAAHADASRQTFVHIMGVAEAQAIVNDLIDSARAALQPFGEPAAVLHAFAEHLRLRDH